MTRRKIEQVRAELNRLIGIYPLTHPEVCRVSEELDCCLNQYAAEHGYFTPESNASPEEPPRRHIG